MCLHVLNAKQEPGPNRGGPSAEAGADPHGPNRAEADRQIVQKHDRGGSRLLLFERTRYIHSAVGTLIVIAALSLPR